VRRYLAEFLSDPRVVQLPRFLWLPILHGIVLRTRPAKSAKKYEAVWMPEGSPLAVHTRRQTKLLGDFLSQEKTSIEYAMRYGEPTVADGLRKLSGCRKIIVLPLYPQFSRSTTESIRDVLGTSIGPKVAMVETFHDHPAYIAALAAGVQRHWVAHGKGEKLLMSFHGLPQRAVDLGDPYQAQCVATTDALRKRMGLDASKLMLTFQSRFGFDAWLQPYTDKTIAQLAKDGVRRIAVVTVERYHRSRTSPCGTFFNA